MRDHDEHNDVFNEVIRSASQDEPSGESVRRLRRRLAVAGIVAGVGLASTEAAAATGNAPAGTAATKGLLGAGVIAKVTVGLALVGAAIFGVVRAISVSEEDATGIVEPGNRPARVATSSTRPTSASLRSETSRDDRLLPESDPVDLDAITGAGIETTRSVDRGVSGSARRLEAKKTNRRQSNTKSEGGVENSVPELKGIGDEVALIEEARTHLAPDPARALATAERHRARFPTGNLDMEREMIALMALEKLDRHEEACRRAAAFIQKYPRSTYVAELKQRCAGRVEPSY